MGWIEYGKLAYGSMLTGSALRIQNHEYVFEGVVSISESSPPLEIDRCWYMMRVGANWFAYVVNLERGKLKAHSFYTPPLVHFKAMFEFSFSDFQSYVFCLKYLMQNCRQNHHARYVIVFQHKTHTHFNWLRYLTQHLFIAWDKI